MVEAHAVPRGPLVRFLHDSRASARLAMAMRIASMLIGGIASLIFTRLLLQSMGAPMYGAFLSFSALTRLGGLSDLGIGSGLATRANIMLGKQEGSELAVMLQSARGLIIFIAGGVLVLFVLFSPITPQWLGFTSQAVGGPPALLFAVGAITCSVFVLAGYFHALNFACGNVTWPVFPTLVIGQLAAPALHLLLAAHGLPLWVQFIPYTASTILIGAVAWLMLRVSHPQFARILPVCAKVSVWRNLATVGLWSFLTSLGTFIFLLTDRLVINFFFGSSAVPSYVLNYKLCEFAISILGAASFASLPKLTLWINSSHIAERIKGAEGMRRLNLYQTCTGLAFSLGYLFLNDAFINVWLGPEYQAPLSLQIIFAAILVVYVGGDASAMVASRCGDNGVRTTGIAAGICAAINVCLSLVAAAYGSIVGVATASLLAQSVLGVWLAFQACKYLSIPAPQYIARCWLSPLLIVFLSGCLMILMPAEFPYRILVQAGAKVVLFVVFCHYAGLRIAMLREEIHRARTAVRKWF